METRDKDRMESRGNRDRDGRKAGTSRDPIDRNQKKSTLDKAGSPGRTPGNAEGDRSDIEEWLKEDSTDANSRKE